MAYDFVTAPIASGTKLAGRIVETDKFLPAQAVSADQDPIFDHVNGAKVALTASTAATVLTPPAGAKFARFSSTVDCFLRFDGTAAADAAGSIRLFANVPETLPVTAGTAVSGFATVAGTVYATPMKER